MVCYTYLKVTPLLNLFYFLFLSFQINDFPDFLQGEQRDNALHIGIKYQEEVKVKVKNKKRRSKSKSKERTPHGVPDLIITRSGEESDRLNKSANSKSSSLASLHSKHRSLDESEFLTGVSDDDLLDVNSNSSSDRLANSLPVSELKKLAMSISDTSSENELSQLDSGDVKKRSHSMSGVEGGETCRPLPQRPLHNPSDHIPKVDEPNTYTAQVATTLVNRRNSFSSSSSTKSSQRSLPSPDIVTDAKKKSQPFQFPRSSSTSTLETFPENMHTSLRRLSVGRTRSLDVPPGDEGVESDSQESVEITEMQDRELHLYILSAVSPILMHLRSTWNNHTIVSISTH